MQAPSHNRSPLEEMEAVLDSRKMVAFIGSGASCGVYENWNELVRKIYEQCVGENTLKWKEMAGDALMDAAEKAKICNSHLYYRAVGDVFKKKSISRNIYRCLAKSPFRNYITTNFDSLLADELVQLPENSNNEIVFHYPGVMGIALHRPKTVVHVHGYIKPGVSPTEEMPIVLARSEFNEAYSAGSLLPDFLRQLFREYPVCFIGCSIQDMFLKNILDQVKSIRQNLERARHQVLPPLFILLEKAVEPQKQIQEADVANVRSEAAETQYYEEMGIRVVRFSREPEFLGLDNLLRKWAKLKEPKIFAPQWDGSES